MIEQCVQVTPGSGTLLIIAPMFKENTNYFLALVTDDMERIHNYPD